MQRGSTRSAPREVSEPRCRYYTEMPIESRRHSDDRGHGAAVVLDGGQPVQTTLSAEVRQVLNDHARLPLDANLIDERADLFQAGMSSHASVNVMLALEDTFDIEFPDSMLTRNVFESIASIMLAVAELTEQAA